MIWTLKVTCAAGPYRDTECIRYIELDEQASLYDLHVAIQDAVNFDDEYEFLFFTSTSHRGRRELLPEGAVEGPGVDPDVYEDMPAATAIPTQPRQRLFYLFNPDADWIFEVRREPGEKPPSPHEFYPLVRDELSVGPDPMQYGDMLHDCADADEAAEHRERLRSTARAFDEDDEGDDEDDAPDIRCVLGNCGEDEDEDEDW